MYASDATFMQLALSLARRAADEDEVPVGAVITHNGQVIAKAYNQVETLRDPTAHAEMLAITQAASTLGEKWLYGCTLYVTVEPCSMCAGALVLARLKRLVYATEDPKAGACGSVFNLVESRRLNHRIECHHGLFKEDCSTLMSGFFLKKRQ